MTGVLSIDGSMGEGGGQVLRTSLALSLVTGRPFRMQRIRAGRRKPGLQRQHLTAVLAAAEVSRAAVEGAAIGSLQLTFSPREVQPGEYRFAVGTAGSTTLVLQTVLPALWTAAGPSQLTLEGGTHNPWAPPFEFLQKTFVPILNRMGPTIEATLVRPGFYPAGGGLITVSVQPRPQLKRIDLLHRGPIRRHTARAVVSRLPLHIARRELDTIRHSLHWSDDDLAAATVDAIGPGNAVGVEIEAEHVTEVFTGFRQKGVPAERVADGVVRQARRYLATEVPAGEHLADQLLIPMALAGGGAFRTLAPSSHTRTNIEVVGRFLDVRIDTEEIADDEWQITVTAPSHTAGS